MNIFVFGSSLTSTYWNGAATYYRGMYKNLQRLGHKVTFAEPAIYDRQKHRDAEISYAEICVYETPRDIPRLLKRARRADVIIKHSGIGADDSRLEDEVLDCRTQKNRVIFWDVDAPATLSRLDSDPWDPFRAVIREYDAIFTYGGGPPVVSHYEKFGAQACLPIYNGLDPETHHPVAPDPRPVVRSGVRRTSTPRPRGASGRILSEGRPTRSRTVVRLRRGRLGRQDLPQTSAGLAM